MSKMFQFHEEALGAMLRGIKTLARAVRVTLGPKGRNVVIKRGFGAPFSTKDGVTVAKEITLKDKFENMGVQLVKEVASKTSDVAGDGTTTAIVLAEAIFSQGVKNVSAGANPTAVKRGIDKAVAKIHEELNKLAKPIKTSEEIRQIATISANNDPEIGKIISEAMDKVGKDGIITVDEAQGIETVLDVVEGMQFDKGYVSPYFVTNPENMQCVFNNAWILITDQKINGIKELVPLLEQVMQKGQKPLLIIADDIDSEALATLVVNKLKAGLQVCAVKAPGFGDRRKAMLQDIAILTGGTLVSEEVGLSLADVGLEVLGTAKVVKVSKDDTTIVDGTGSQKEIKKRVSQIRAELEKSTSSYDKEKLEQRLAHLVGGVAVVKVGATTETEMKEKKARVEDALHATRAAAAEGVVPGGGVALLRAVRGLESLKLTGDEAIGVNIVRLACFAPASWIAENCGKQGNLIAEKIYESKDDFGYNGLTDEFTDMIKAGVLDPVMVTKTALANAASISGLLLLTAAMVTEKPKPKSKTPAPSMGGMGGGMGGMGGMDMGGMM